MKTIKIVQLNKINRLPNELWESMRNKDLEIIRHAHSSQASIKEKGE